MSKLGLVIKREYLRRVSKKSFILLTFLTPIFFVALLFVPLWLSSIKSDEVRRVAIIDNTGKYAQLFENTDNYVFVNSDKSLEEYRDAPNKELFAVLSITKDLLDTPKAATLYSDKQVPQDLERIVNQVLRQQIETDKLATFDIPNLKEIIQESKVNFSIQTIKWGKDGTEISSSSTVASITGLVMTVIIFMFIMMYGSMVMQGVMEEKTNRIIEVMISSVKPFDLMMGKIIGIGLVGITQIFLWGILTVALAFVGQFFLGGGMDPAAMESMTQIAGAGSAAMQEAVKPEVLQILESINFTEIILYFVVYFIGGYLLFASLFAAIGASIDNPEDSNQFMTPIMILMMFAYFAGIYSMENPDGPLAFWCSMFPLTSPIVMMVRVPFDVPIWQAVLSVALLFATAIGTTWISAKIYRVGILMYGKKPTMKEIAKWVKFK